MNAGSPRRQTKAAQFLGRAGSRQRTPIFSTRERRHVEITHPRPPLSCLLSRPWCLPLPQKSASVSPGLASAAEVKTAAAAAGSKTDGAAASSAKQEAASAAAIGKKTESIIDTISATVGKAGAGTAGTAGTTGTAAADIASASPADKAAPAPGAKSTASAATGKTADTSAGGKTSASPAGTSAPGMDITGTAAGETADPAAAAGDEVKGPMKAFRKNTDKLNALRKAVLEVCTRTPACILRCVFYSFSPSVAV